MRHYIAYNKVREWGDYSVDVGDTEFGHYSGHHKSKLEKTIDQTIWVISGEKINGSMVYKLCSTYKPTHIEDDEAENPETGKIEFTGLRCVIGKGFGFIPPIEVTGFQWFAELFKEQNRFSLGLNRIKSEVVVHALEKIRDDYFGNSSTLDVPKPTILQEIEQCKDSYETLQETTRESVIQSRIGQGQFRASLVQYWHGCSVSGCKQIELLRASHIKPWRYSSNTERLDVFNGLLLLPNLDACFDSGLISFDGDGKILISSELSESTLSHLGINSSLKLLQVEQRHKEFLRFHRNNVFRP
jgi:hypothetical protein